jgi:outer membrane protein OmpA-like peptidoglycan-associated protein
MKFRNGTALLTPDDAASLDEMARVLLARPDLRMRIEGHTDDRGIAANNTLLSVQRAEAVRDALVKRGVDAARLSAIGRGSEAPIAPNDTPEGRSLNRRVELHLERAPR